MLAQLFICFDSAWVTTKQSFLFCHRVALPLFASAKCKIKCTDCSALCTARVFCLFFASFCILPEAEPSASQIALQTAFCYAKRGEATRFA
jgi:hypothetical protein